jgi:hypothetical protein
MDKQQPKERQDSVLHPASPLKQSEMLNISLAIDTYEDIFSDFDPRPYHERALSEDFLAEVRRRHIPHKKGGFEVRFIVPDKVRDLKIEAMAKKRLKSYFKEEEKFTQMNINSKRNTGIVYILAGTIVLLIIAYVGIAYPDSTEARLIELLLAPAAWFGMWEGMGKVLEKDEALQSKFQMSRKLAESAFAFIPESEAFKLAQPDIQPGNKEAIIEEIKEEIREQKTSKEQKKEPPKEAAKEQPKDQKKEPQKETPKEVQKEQKKEQQNTRNA